MTRVRYMHMKFCFVTVTDQAMMDQFLAHPRKKYILECIFQPRHASRLRQNRNKLIASRYHADLLTPRGGRIQRQKLRVDYFNVILPYFFEENLNLFANLKAEMIYKSIGSFGCGSCGCPIENLRKNMDNMVIWVVKFTRKGYKITKSYFQSQFSITRTTRYFFIQEYQSSFF